VFSGGDPMDSMTEWEDMFGTINPYGNILYSQWIMLGETPNAIENFQDELRQLIEEFWVQNYQWLTADNDLPEGPTQLTSAVPHDSSTIFEPEYDNINADNIDYTADGSKITK
jgi:hypothetical protein